MQKKVISLLFVAAICAMVFVGCKKDTEVVTLGVQNEVSYNGKVYIDNSYNPCFLQVGEQVNVNGESYDVEYDATSGQYKVSCQSNEDGNYYAVYPATNSCTGSTCTIALPHYQQYDCDASGVQNVKLPAGATILGNSGTKLYFFNLGSLLEVQWTNNTTVDYQVTGIEVTVPGKAIWGNGTATLNGTNSTLVMDESNNKDKSNNRVILTIPTAKRETVNANGGVSRKYYIVLPTLDSKRVLVNVRVADPTSANGQKVLSIKMSTQSEVDMPRNYIVPLHLSNAPTQDNELSGYFSVSDNLKVVFSRGNLQHVGSTSHSTGTWKFADRQYDFFGGLNNTQDGYNLTNTHDLFCWSESETENFGMYLYDPDDAHWSGLANTTFKDWGYYKTISGDAPQTWFTLTSQEWYYLFHSRVGGTGAELRGKAKITGIEGHQATEWNGDQTAHRSYIEGFILLPDDWTSDDLPEGLTFTAHNADGSSYENVYTVSQWAQMEAAGAMFLPAAGYGTNYEDEPDSEIDGGYVEGTYEVGRYWSSTRHSGGVGSSFAESYYAGFVYQSAVWYLQVSNMTYDPNNTGGQTYANHDNEWWRGYSVRLVKPAPGYTDSRSIVGTTSSSK